MTSWNSAFTISDAGSGRTLRADEIPAGVAILVARLAKMGHLASIGDNYRVRQGTELLLALLAKDNEDSAQALEDLTEPVPLGRYDRLQAADIFGGDLPGGRP